MVTFGCRDALASAELARIDNHELDAERLYEESIRGAHAAGAVNVEAIASERAAQFYLGRGLDRIARTYLLHARDCFNSVRPIGMIQLRGRNRHPLVVLSREREHRKSMKH